MSQILYSGECVLDEEVIEELESLRGNNERESLMSSLVSVFTESAEETIQRARTGASASQFNDVAECVHKLKGSSGSIGALALFNCCKQIDKMHSDNNLKIEDLQPAVDLISKEYLRAKMALNAHISSHVS